MRRGVCGGCVQISGSNTFGIQPIRVRIDGITLTNESFSGAATATLPAGLHDLAFEDFSNIGAAGGVHIPDFDAQLNETLSFSINGSIFDISEPPILPSFLTAVVVFFGVYYSLRHRPDRPSQGHPVFASLPRARRATS
jgi:hypothetical protein